MIATNSDGATTKETVVNGNDVILWRYSNGSENNQSVRQVAAALPRSMDGLRNVDAAPKHTAHVWLYPPSEDEEMRTFEAPPGYQIVDVSHFPDGDVCVTLEVDR